MERRLEIDTIRGLACLMLVAYHVIGTPTTGLLLTEGWLRDLNDYLAYIRMPLFTFLSGYVYGWRPYRTGAGSFLAGKARRLLIPLLVVGTLFAVIQAMVPGTNTSVENWYMLHIIPYAHFWFVESLFIIFLVIVLLESFGLLSSLFRVAVALAAASVLYVFFFGTEIFSISGSLYLMPYFLGGLACCRFSLTGRHRWRLFMAFWLLCLAILVWQNFDGLVSKRSFAALLFGVASCVLLVSSGWTNRALAYVGLYSYGIYLFHAFFTAASRIALNKVGVADLALLVLAGCALGIGGPIVVEKLACQNRIANTLLLGKKWTPGLPWVWRFKISQS